MKKEGEPIKIATLDKKGQGKEYFIEYTCTIVNICLSITLSNLVPRLIERDDLMSYIMYSHSPL